SWSEVSFTLPPPSSANARNLAGKPAITVSDDLPANENASSPAASQSETSGVDGRHQILDRSVAVLEKGDHQSAQIEALRAGWIDAVFSTISIEGIRQNCEVVRIGDS